MRSVWSLINFGFSQFVSNGHLPSDHTAQADMRLQNAILATTVCRLTTCNAAPSTQYVKSCDSVNKGYQCSPEISHYWGQYSPFFKVESDVSPELPDECDYTFAAVLSRHGARDPTASKTKTYGTLVNNTKKAVKSFSGKYSFLNNYTYTLGADQLTVFGQQEMINSGKKFYKRYSDLVDDEHLPFFRSSGEARVVESAQNFSQGFHAALVADPSEDYHTGDDKYPYPILVISEDAGTNNTLNHDLCTAFENGTDSKIGASAQAKWLAVFAPPIQARLNNDLKPANFSLQDVISFMDLCPFNTVASSNGTFSPFCSLFTEDEWHQYDYYETLGKYYGYGPGNPLGPTQGVGFVNELIARLTNKPVNDTTSTNRTLDSNPATFPVDKNHYLFADFSHDNDMTGILSAIGVYSGTTPLSNTTIETTAQTNGYSAAWTVPFAARIYFEKMTCSSRGGHGRNFKRDDKHEQQTEYVRIVVNDRVLPLTQCGGDSLGRCTLDKFVSSLSFARSGGLWKQCFM